MITLKIKKKNNKVAFLLNIGSKNLFIAFFFVIIRVQFLVFPSRLKLEFQKGRISKTSNNFFKTLKFSNTDLWDIHILEGAYKRPEMKFRFALKKMFTLLLLPSEMKYNFVSRVVGVKRSIKKCKQIRARYKVKHAGGSNVGIF